MPSKVIIIVVQGLTVLEHYTYFPTNINYIDLLENKIWFENSANAWGNY